MMTEPLPLQRRRSRRGALLVEAALAVGVAISLVALTFSVTRELQIRTDAALLASEKRSIIVASRNFIRENRADIIQQLFDAAQTGGGEGVAVFTLTDLADAGYLASSLAPGGVLGQLYGQDYLLMARAVFQDDAGTPPATLTEIDMDPFGNGDIDPRFIDGDLSNQEISIESILFTVGGTDIPLNILARTIEQTELLNAGSIFGTGIASGALGAMQFDITGFSTLPQYADTGPGRFASPISVGPQGLLGDPASPLDAIADQLREAFLRCTDIDSSDPRYNDCVSAPGNTVWTNIVIENFDSNLDGTIDVYPTIDGLTRLRCANPDGDLADAVDPDVFLIDCETTRLSGNLEVEGSSISLAGQTLAERRDIAGQDETVVSADRLALLVPDGGGGRIERDVSEFVFDSRILAAREIIDVPECPSVTLDGLNAMEPRAIAHVSAFADPWGRPVAGVRANVERGLRTTPGDPESWTADPTGPHWMVRIRYVVSDNFCDSDFADPIPTNLVTTFETSPAGLPTRQPTLCTGGAFAGPGAGADIYELFPNASGEDFGAASISVRCF